MDSSWSKLKLTRERDRQVFYYYFQSFRIVPRKFPLETLASVWNFRHWCNRTSIVLPIRTPAIEMKNDFLLPSLSKKVAPPIEKRTPKVPQTPTVIRMRCRIVKEWGRHTN